MPFRELMIWEKLFQERHRDQPIPHGNEAFPAQSSTKGDDAWRSICRTFDPMSRQPLPRRSLPVLPAPSILSEKSLERKAGGRMTPLEKIQSMKMPFAELKGVTFTEAGM